MRLVSVRTYVWMDQPAFNKHDAIFLISFFAVKRGRKALPGHALK